MNVRAKSADQVKIAIEPEDYVKLNLDPDAIKPWEDGMRTDGKRGSFEWWYCDAEFEDGTTIVVVFYTKDHFDVRGPYQPTVDIEITDPDGKKTMHSSFEPKGTLLRASKTECDVRVHESFLKYQGSQYILHFDDGDIQYDAVMTATMPMWRPATGHTIYGNHEEHYFAWFVAQPAARVDASLKTAGKTKELHGLGYHDHNWGNISMEKLLNHWYWGRAKIGDYNIIVSDMITVKKYGFIRLPIIMIAKNGNIITDNSLITKITRKDTIMHPVTKKFMDNHIIYEQQISDREKYTIDFIRHQDIISVSLLERVSPIKRFIARFLRINPTYTRVQGEVNLTVELDGQTEVIKSEGLWEQMFFGSNKHATINDLRDQLEKEMLKYQKGKSSEEPTGLPV